MSFCLFTNWPFWPPYLGNFFSLWLTFSRWLEFHTIVDTLLAVAWARLVVICHWTLFVGSFACCCCCWAPPPPPPWAWTRWWGWTGSSFLFAPVPAFVVRTSRVSTVDSTSLTEKRRVIDNDKNREKDKDKDKIQVRITTWLTPIMPGLGELSGEEVREETCKVFSQFPGCSSSS